MAESGPTRLFVGNLPWSTEESQLLELFNSVRPCLKATIERGRQGRSRGFAIVEYPSAMDAMAAMQALNGHMMGDRSITVREDKAVPTEKQPRSGGKSRAPPAGSTLPPAGESSRCYVGNLAWQTTEQELMAHCQAAGTVLQAEIARQASGRSKGWGLVDFASPQFAQQAINTLHNTELHGRSIIVRLERSGERPAKPAGGAAQGGGGRRQPPAGSIANSGRPENSSGLQIVVRNLPWTTTSEDLREVFQQVGNVVRAESVTHADTGRSKGWGTVLFETPEQAQAAIAGFNGVALEGRPMQIKIDRFA